MQGISQSSLFANGHIILLCKKEIFLRNSLKKPTSKSDEK